jgi:hypothetical protein
MGHWLRAIAASVLHLAEVGGGRPMDDGHATSDDDDSVDGGDAASAGAASASKPRVNFQLQNNQHLPFSPHKPVNRLLTTTGACVRCAGCCGV